MTKYFDIRHDLWREEFQKALSYGEYLELGDPTHAERWRQMALGIALPPERRPTIQQFVRRLNILVLSGIWCGDCVRQGPILQQIADESPLIDLRFVERVEGTRLVDELRICGGMRVPVVVFLSEEFFELGRFGDRLLTRYRSKANTELAAACETGIVAPAADDLRAEMDEWLDIFERMHLIVRLAPALRAKHGD